MGGGEPVSARLTVEEARQAGLLPEPELAPKRKGKARGFKQKSKGEETFALQCEANKHLMPPTHREYEFAKSIGRKWRIDFAWPDVKVGMEIEGLVVRRIGKQLVTTGRHAHPDGFREDCEKYATAAILGWTIVRFERDQVTDGTALSYALRILTAKGWRRA